MQLVTHEIGKTFCIILYVKCPLLLRHFNQNLQKVTNFG